MPNLGEYRVQAGALAPAQSEQAAYRAQRVHGRRVLAALGRPEAHEALIQPSAIRGRDANLLGVDNGRDPLGDMSVAAFTALGDTMEHGYRRFILEATRSTANDA